MAVTWAVNNTAWAVDNTLQPVQVFLANAAYSYHDSNPRELSFREGGQVQVITRRESGWYDGVINGKRGWIPGNYLDFPNVLICNDDEED